jgi:hypothetical protein
MSNISSNNNFSVGRYNFLSSGMSYLDMKHNSLC